MVIENSWMVLEIQEGGNPPNLADSLGIESLLEVLLCVCEYGSMRAAIVGLGLNNWGIVGVHTKS